MQCYMHRLFLQFLAGLVVVRTMIFFSFALLSSGCYISGHHASQKLLLRRVSTSTERIGCDKKIRTDPSHLISLQLDFEIKFCKQTWWLLVFLLWHVISLLRFDWCSIYWIQHDPSRSEEKMKYFNYSSDRFGQSWISKFKLLRMRG